ncbi:exodeoxyribonuclease V subunit beta [Deferribacteres bacterium DY0037]
MKRKQMELLTAPLTGTSLIEANAGTGKTYNITALFTRMVTELQYPVESILVVTYTNAAVSDLKAKIYKRLNDVLLAMVSLRDSVEITMEDEFPLDYALKRKENLTKDIKLLKGAVRDFDQCAIFTIHGFCQRMLKENAFSGHVAYDIDLTGDSREILKKPVYNFWRENIYKTPQEAIKLLKSLTPDSLINFYMQVQSNQSITVAEPAVIVEPEDILKIISELTDCMTTVKTCFTSNETELRELLDSKRKNFPLDKRSYQARYVNDSFNELKKLTESGNIHCPLESENKKIYRLTNHSIEGKIEHVFFSLVHKWYDKEAEFRELSRLFESTLKYKLCLYMEEVLETHKQKNNIQSYDDLITRMRNSVMENEGHGNMSISVNRKFNAALIDEFQDTDPHQYDIFNTVFGRYGKPFFMIGDPKQAIYSFRGADVYAYLKAASEEGNQYTLTKNFRSAPELVDAVNSFFQRENAFMEPRIEYIPSVGGHKELALTVAEKPQPHMTVWETEKTKPEEIALSTARHISELLNKSSYESAHINGKAVKPSDIAVLCRNKKEMTMVKEALTYCRVPAVVSGSENVFSSDEAVEMVNILSAVISPFSQSHIKTALASSAFGYTAKEIYHITETDQWDDITEEFRNYNDMISLRGFAPMFFHMASVRKLYKRLAKLPSGERKLTNLIHITELAQQFEANRKAAPQDILRWMKEKISNAEMRDEESELKMDSDENAVTIITIHKSKGLEYNIVYTPFLMFSRGNNKRPDYAKYHKEDKFILDVAGTDEAIEKTQQEEQQEKLRIAYVALTRAKSVCFTAWGEGTGHDKSALAYLINGEQSKFDSGRLHSFFRGSNVAIKPLPDTAVQTYKGSEIQPTGKNRTFTSEITPPWQINSFSRLIHSSSSVRDTDQFTMKDETSDSSGRLDIFTFPKGAKAGTCLHECMEETDFENFSALSVAETVEERLKAFSFDTDFTPAVTQNILTILNKDMHGTCLKDLKQGDYIHEMEFQIATKPFRPEPVSEIFRNSGQNDYADAASTLSFDAMQGFMNGFADLIFCQRGQYYVLDWKSNHLGMTPENYSMERMHAEMLGSHYYMQMHIYTLALHMHLQRYLKGYSYDKHMGGGIYVFMRGIHEKGNEGIYFHRPEKDTICRLEELVKR